MTQWLYQNVAIQHQLLRVRSFTLSGKKSFPGACTISAMNGLSWMSSFLQSTCTAYSPGSVGQYRTSQEPSPLSSHSIFAGDGPSTEKPDWTISKSEVLNTKGYLMQQCSTSFPKDHKPKIEQTYPKFPHHLQQLLPQSQQTCPLHHSPVPDPMPSPAVDLLQYQASPQTD